MRPVPPTPGPPRDDSGRLVSIIILSHNYARYIGETIRSVLAQTYPHWQLVVVDDASQDDSLAVIRSFRDPRIEVLSLAERQGACAAYNHALARCRGTYVGSLDADDLFLPTKLERQVGLFEERPDLDVVGTWIVEIDSQGRENPNGRYASAINRPLDFDRLDTWVPDDHLCHSSVLLRRDRHLQVGGLDPDLPLAPDFELWIRCLAAGMRFALIPERLTGYRVHGANVSHTCDPVDLWLELCFLFTAHVAPLVVRRGRSDLLAPGIRSLVAQLGPVDVGLRGRVMHRLAGFPLLPRRVTDFRIALPAFLGEDWPRIGEAIRARARSARATPASAPAPRPRRRDRMVIVDDYFPRLDTGFRVAEFNWYLEHTDCTVYSTVPDFEEVWKEYAAVHPRWADRVAPFDPRAAADCSLLYTVFVSNAYRALALAEAHDLPLAFTLYPGGGFGFHDMASDLMLSRLGHSERLVRVIVTQRSVLDYVVGAGLLPADKVELIWGVASPAAPEEPRRSPADKENLDLGFVANRYMPRGIDKGFDVFVEVVRRLALVDGGFRFHVAGGFGPEDVGDGELASRITFHGRLPTHRLPEVYSQLDLVVSPNRAFRLRPGAVDGFPTASCTDAALHGVAVLCTDPMGENDPPHRRFVPDEEIRIIGTDPDEIAASVLELGADRAALRRLAEAGRARARHLYHADRQLVPRLAVLRSQLAAVAS